MKALRVGGYIVAALLALIVLALLAAHWLINPNDYKNLITQSVQRSTGRQLQLTGDLKLSVFPSIALETGAATLGNPPGFSGSPFATVRRISMSARLLPLLHSQLQIGRIEVDGLDLELQRDSHGRGNWQGAIAQAATPVSSSTNFSPPALAELAGVSFHDAHVHYQDVTVDKLDLDIGRFASGVAVPMKLSLQLHTSATAQAVPLTVSVPQLRLDLAAQTLQAPQFEAQLGDAHLSGALEASHIIDAPAAQGTFNLAAFAPRPLLMQLGKPLPKTRDPNALGSLALSAQFNYGDNALHLTKLVAALDKSTLRGDLAVTNLDTDAISFALSLDTLDIDAYRAPIATQTATRSAPATSAPTPLPIDTLRALQLDGTFTVGQASFANLKLSQLQLTLRADHGLVQLAPIAAQLYDGHYAGQISLDSRPDVPALSLQQHLTQVDIAALLKDFAKTQRLSGNATLNAQLTAHGLTDDALLRSLDGPVTVNVDKGAVSGVDLWFQINRGMALLQKQSAPSGSDSGSTKFDTFKASATLTDGVAKTNDLQVVSQNLHLTGQGTVNLVSEALNLQLKTTVLKGTAVTAAGGASPGTLVEVPVIVTGSLANPSVQPDLAGLAKGLLQQQLDNHKQDLQQQLQKGLQNLFNSK